MVGILPRRSVNLPSGSLKAILGCALTGNIKYGPYVSQFETCFGQWLGVKHVFVTASGRSAFQLALESLGLEQGAEIIFPMFTFPVIPQVAKRLGYTPVFCDINPETYNTDPEHIEAQITERTGAILATHLFGQPCRIKEIVELAHSRDIKVMEDCAHSVGAMVDGQYTGSFGDIGVFSFAIGKNMPCLGGGAVVTSDFATAERAMDLLEPTTRPPSGYLLKTGLATWATWLITRPWLYALTIYPLLRLKLLADQSLMDSAVGNELLAETGAAGLKLRRFADLQARIGCLHLPHIENFNAGARANAQILTQQLQGLSGIGIPQSPDGEHVYVYYCLTVPAHLRDKLRHYLLRHGIDTKTSDMSDCPALTEFAGEASTGAPAPEPRHEDEILEICVNPVNSPAVMRKAGMLIAAWAREHGCG